MDQPPNFSTFKLANYIMSTITRFEQLEAWKSARELANLVYDVSDEGRFGKDFGLRDQMRRAAVSVMSNIAEGFESRTQALFIEYLGRAKGSAGEARAQAYIAADRNYLSAPKFDRLFAVAEKCSRQISRFTQYLESHPDKKRIREEQTEYEV